MSAPFTTCAKWTGIRFNVNFFVVAPRMLEQYPSTFVTSFYWRRRTQPCSPPSCANFPTCS